MKTVLYIAGVLAFAISMTSGVPTAFAQTQSQIIIERAPPIPREERSKKDKKAKKQQDSQSAPQGMMFMGTGAGPVLAVPVGGASDEDSDSDEENGNTHSEIQIVR
jgi:hypothetical protein